jgi:hypothetical protein
MPAPGQDRLEVVERESEVGGHVTRMPRIAFRVDGILRAADEFAAAALDELGLVEAQVDRPVPRVDGGAFHGCLLRSHRSRSTDF